MHVTTQWWAAAIVGIIFVILGVLTSTPLWLGPTIGIGGWLVGTAWAVNHGFVRHHDAVSVMYTVDKPRAAVDTTLTASITVERPETVGWLPARVQVPIPPGVTATPAPVTITLPAGTTETSVTVTLSFATAGRFTMPSPRVSTTGPFGLYTCTTLQDAAPTLTIYDRPSAVSLGTAGPALLNTYGSHQTDVPGPGIKVEGLREYVPGDDLRRIDWKATARLNTLYVRETESQTERQTVLLVDHRARMAAGPAGERIFDYARTIGVSVIQTAASLQDPIAVYTLGPDGITNVVQLTTARRTHAEAEATLYDLTPTGDASTTDPRTATQAQTRAETLDPETAFGQTLLTYFTDSTQYTLRTQADPLISAVRRAQRNSNVPSLYIIITTDAEPTRLQETLDLATRSQGSVLLFLAPSCLYTTPQAELETAYEQYQAFTQLTRRLDRHPRVTVFELTPEARLQQLVAKRQQATT